MKYEEPKLQIFMIEDADIICESVGGIEDGTDIMLPGTEDGKDTGVYQP